MLITHGHQDGRPSELRGPTFSGSVWVDSLIAGGDAPTVNAVVFPPAGRTYWHHHTDGQLLLVTHGSGLVQTKDGRCEQIVPGDVVWFPAGEVHWHGAGPDTLMSHLAISLGPTNWLDAVTDAEYEAAVRDSRPEA